MSVVRLKVLGIMRFGVQEVASACRHGDPYLVEELFALYAGNVLPWPPGEEIAEVRCEQVSGRGERPVVVKIEGVSREGRRYALACAEMPDGSTVCYPAPS